MALSHVDKPASVQQHWARFIEKKCCPGIRTLLDERALNAWTLDDHPSYRRLLRLLRALRLFRLFRLLPLRLFFFFFDMTVPFVGVRSRGRVT